MESESPRPLTFQEKVQRKRERSKTPTPSAATTPEETASQQRSQGGSSPHRAKIKNQLARAMGGSPTTPVSTPTENRNTRPNSFEQTYHPQQVDSPLASTESTRNIQSSQQYGMQPHEIADEAESRPMLPTRRRKLPKWPPQPEEEEEEHSEQEQQEKPQSLVREEEPVQTQTTSSSVGKAPWIRTSPTVANQKSVNSGGKPSWVRPVAGNKQPQVEETITPVSSQQKVPWARPRTPSPAPDTSSVGSQQQAPWTRSRTPSPVPTTSSVESQQKAPWTRPRIPSPASDTSGVSSQQRAPRIRSRTPSPANVGSQQKAPWARQTASERAPSPVPPAPNAYSQQRAPWVRSRQRPPSPATNTPDEASHPKAPWARSQQRTPSPVPNTNDDTDSQQKPSSVQSQRRTPSPVPDTAGQKRAPWVRPSAREKSPSPVPGAGNGHTQRKAPWVRPSARERSSSPTLDNHEIVYDEQDAPIVQHETDQVPATTRASSLRRDFRSLQRRRARIMRGIEIEKQAAEASTSEGMEEMAAESVSAREEIPVSRPSVQPSVGRIKKWPPVRTEPFLNGFKEQQAKVRNDEAELPTMQNDEAELPEPMTSDTEEEQPSDSLSSQPAAPATLQEPSPSEQAHEAAVKKGPWLRTSPRGPPSPVPTDEGNQNSMSWAQSAARVQSPSPAQKDPAVLASNIDSAKQKMIARSYRKPPPSPVFGTSKYIPPWVKAREAETNNADKSLKNESEGTSAQESQMPDNLDVGPSDEIESPPSPVRSNRKQPIELPLSPSSKILSEVKTRRLPLNRKVDDLGEEPGSDEVAETVISYGGAVIETPKSVNVASMTSSFASGERFSPPSKRNSWNERDASPVKTNNVGSPQSSSYPFSKQSTSPGEPTPDQPQRSPWQKSGEGSGSMQSPEKSKGSVRGKWGQVQSPPPIWSKAARSSGQQSSSKPPTYQREVATMQSPKLSGKPPASPQRDITPGLSPPPAWIKRDASHGDMSSIRSLRWGSKGAQSREPGGLDRSPPPSWVNRDASQGEMSSIRSPDWASMRGPAKGSVDSLHPPSWVDRDVGQDELSPIESPQQSPTQRKVRITVETVDDESANEGETGRSPEPQSAEYEYPAEEEAYARGVGIGESPMEDFAASEQYTSAHRGFYDQRYDYSPPLSEQDAPKSPAISLVQMAMDSVFALDFDLALSQAAKGESFEDDDSAGSSTSRGIAKSTPPERELPEEVKAMLKRSLNRTMSDSGAPDDSGAYEADYFSTDASSAVDQSGSTWNENEISALSNGTGLQSLSPPRKDTSHASPSQAKRALQFPADEPLGKSESKAVPDETLERIREMKISGDPRGGSEAGSSSAMFGNPNTYGSAGGSSTEEKAPSVSDRAKAVDIWSGARVRRSAPTPEEPKSNRVGASFMNLAKNEPNESTIDLGNPTDFSIQVSPDSPRQASLVGTSPALLSDSPPQDFPTRKTVRFGDMESKSDSRHDYEEEPPPSTSDDRRVTEEGQETDKSEPTPPPVEQETSPVPSAGAKQILRYYTQATHEISRMDDPEEWTRRDPDLGDMMSEVTDGGMDGNANGQVDWRRKKPPLESRTKSPTWSSSFGGAQDPFSKQDAQDPFFKQDDPFATSKSADSDFASDFGEGFNPFLDTETNDAFDFEKEEEAEFFSPYGDAPKAQSVSTSKSQTKLTPSRRDRRRHREASVRYDDFYAQQQGTSYLEPSPSNVDDSYVEYYAQHASYNPSASASTEISRKDGTYLLEI